jgi:hypothetical protein
MQGEPSQNRLARRPHHDDDLPPIWTVATAVNHVPPHQAIDQLDRGVVLNLESLGQDPDGRRRATFQSLDLQQRQILLGLDAGGPRGDLAASQESPDAVAQLGERRIVDRSRRARTRDGFRPPLRHGGHCITAGRQPFTAPAVKPVT